MTAYCRQHNLIITNEEKLDKCMACRLAKAKDRQYHRNAHLLRSSTPGDYWHIDLIGPLRIKTLGGKRFALLCTDDASGYRKLYLLNTKGEQIKTFETLYAWASAQLDTKIRQVRTDGDWTTNAWTEFRDTHGIEQLQTTTDHPNSNPVAERTNGITCTMARCLLIAAGLPPSFFGEALNAATYILNRTHSTRSGPTTTPLQVLNPSQQHSLELRAYGCHAWVRKTSSTGKALPRADEGILVGYDEMQRAYRVFIPNQRKVLVSDAVTFDETTIGLRTTRPPWRDLPLSQLIHKEEVRNLRLNKSIFRLSEVLSPRPSNSI